MIISNKKIEAYEGNEANDIISKPSHYNGDEGIDLIEFCRQQFTEEEFRGAMKFTEMRYALRTGRKDDELQEQKKLREYADRNIKRIEKDRGIE